MRITKTFGGSGAAVTQQFLAMQGLCWQYELSSGRQAHYNYLNNTKKFYTDQNCPRGSSCPYGTLYSSLGMSLHSEGNTVLFGAPGTFTWEGTVAVLE